MIQLLHRNTCQMKSMWELYVQKQFYYHIIKISILVHIAFFFCHKYKITHSWSWFIFGNEFPKSINNKILKNRFMCNITFSLWSLYSDRPYPNFWNLKEWIVGRGRGPVQFLVKTSNLPFLVYLFIFLWLLVIFQAVTS